MNYTLKDMKHVSQKKFPNEKKDAPKKSVLRASAPCCLDFNSRFLFELKRKVRVSKSGSGIFHLPFRYVLIKVLSF